MSSPIRTRTFAVATLGFVAIGGAFLLGRAHAAVPTGAGSLIYSGVLEDLSGNPLTGNHQITVHLYGQPTGGTTECTVNTTELKDGRFQVDLGQNPKCAEKIQAGDTYVEVDVDGPSLGRTKLAAVPYALEAAHATKADNATTATVALNAASNFTVPGTLEVQGIANLGFRTVSASGNPAACPTNGSMVTTCTCAAGEVALAGGVSAGGNHALRVSRPGETAAQSREWVFLCTNAAGTDVKCGDVWVLCARVARMTQ